MKRTLLAVLLAAGTVVSAQSFAAASAPAIVHYNDENDLSWLYQAPTAKQFPADSGKPASPSPVAHYNDSDNLSWLYQPPTAKQFPADSGQPATVLSNIPHTGDEDNLSWLYQAPTAHAFNESGSTSAAGSSAPANAE